MAPPTQDPQPTLIDQELQEKAWALLLDLAMDLKIFKNFRAASALCDGRPIFNPLKMIFTSQQATSAIQATLPNPKMVRFKRPPFCTAGFLQATRGNKFKVRRAFMAAIGRTAL
jgi:hypothetical protein